MTTTPRLLIPRQTGGLPANLPAALDAAIDQIDTVATAFDQGSVLPDPIPPAGTLFWHTTAKVLYYSDGTSIAPAMPTSFPFPIGGVLDWPAASNPPAGPTWLELIGQTISQVDYPELFAAWGVAGSSLVLQDRRGRTPIGAGQGPSMTNRQVGQSGGAERVTLATTQIPSHGHTASTAAAGDHAHSGAALANGSQHSHPATSPANVWSPDNNGSLAVIVNSGGSGWALYSHDLNIGPDFSTHQHDSLAINNAGSHAHGVTVNAAGGGDGHENMPPFAVTRYFVRAK